MPATPEIRLVKRALVRGLSASSSLAKAHVAELRFKRKCRTLSRAAAGITRAVGRRDKLADRKCGHPCMRSRARRIISFQGTMGEQRWQPGNRIPPFILRRDKPRR